MDRLAQDVTRHIPPTRTWSAVDRILTTYLIPEARGARYHLEMNPALVRDVVPRVTTDRLLLRGFRREDFDTYAEAFADPVFTEHLSGTLDRRSAWRSFGAATGFWLINGGGWWAVELRETGQLVGTVGAFFRETSPELEIGWTIFRPFWRRGFASEAAKAALDFAMEAHTAPRAYALINADNVASIRVSERLGMRYDTDVDFYGETVRRYVVEREDRSSER